MRIKVLFYYVANAFLSNAMDKFCSAYKSNLSGGLTSLEDLRSGASGAGPLNCGVLAGTSEASVVCSHVAKLSLGKVLGLHSGVLMVHHWGCCSGYKFSLLLAECGCGFA